MTDVTSQEYSELDCFLRLCATLTDFSVTELISTGMGKHYLALCQQQAGNQNIEWLLQKSELLGAEPSEFTVRAELLADERAGPLCRHLMVLWLLGIWDPLPIQWIEAYYDKTKIEGRSYVPSEKAYVEGLVWKVIEAHPPGSRHTGFGSWSEPPGNE